MQDEIIQQLTRLNRGFYQTFSASFSETRARLQPGVARTLDRIADSDSILDLGCGNGGVARHLAQRGHQGVYYGFDSSSALIEVAKKDCPHPQVHFFVADLVERDWPQRFPESFNHVFAFAVLHHIPGEELRIQILNQIHNLLSADGKFTLSNWNFPESKRLLKRILPWSTIDIDADDVDSGDALLDWRRDGYGLRYVHHFSENELVDLAQATGFRVRDTFYSDGEGGRLGLYQVWEKGK
jgi:tRNA (uracil-5-)-methyltransferase TRM9